MQESLIPAYTTTLVGRIQETSEVISLLLNPDIQLVTLTGTSGTGKTRLSLEVITALEVGGQKNIFFIPMAAITNPKLVLPTIAQHLQIRDTNTQPLIQQLIDYFTQQDPSIIILDNFEQVLSAKTEIAQLLTGVPQLTILITSQEALNIPSETVYTIPGLHVPNQIPTTVEEAQTYGAIQLFTQRIQIVQPHFRLQQESITPITEICQMLEGLPLAIEIVAAHSDVLLPKDLRLLVRQHLMLYRLKTQKAIGRQRIILPIIEWSLLRLPQEAQALFQHLGAFRGGWNIDALKAIAADQAYDIETVLNILIERHLILRQQMKGDTIRYMMLDAVQAYADKQFNQYPIAKRNSLNQHHMTFMQDLAQTAHTISVQGNPQQTYYTNRLTHEMPNIRLLLEWALAVEPEQAVPLIISLGRFWIYSGYVKEGFEWYEHVEAKAQLTSEQYAALRTRQATFLRAMGQLTLAIKYVEEGIEYAEQTENHRIQSRGYNTLSIIMTDMQELDKAHTYLEEALKHARLCDMQEIMPSLLGNLGVLELNNRNYDKALHLFEEVIELAEQRNLNIPKLVGLINIGCIYIAQRNSYDAVRVLDQAIAIAQTIQAQEAYAVSLHFKAEALLLQSGDLRAIPLLLESINILRQQGWPIQLYGALEKCAIVLQQHDKLRAAGIITGAVNRICEEIGIKESDNQHHPGLQDMLTTIAQSIDFQQGMQEGRGLNQDDLIPFIMHEFSVLLEQQNTDNGEQHDPGDA